MKASSLASEDAGRPWTARLTAPGGEALLLRGAVTLVLDSGTPWPAEGTYTNGAGGDTGNPFRPRPCLFKSAPTCQQHCAWADVVTLAAVVAIAAAILTR